MHHVEHFSEHATRVNENLPGEFRVNEVKSCARERGSELRGDALESLKRASLRRITDLHC